MRLIARKVSDKAGFTLGEMMVAIGMMSLVGLCAYYVFINGFIMYAKNTAENLAHDQGRIAVNRLVRDIHAAVSIPQLGHMVAGGLSANPTAPKASWEAYGTNTTFWADAGTGPSAGIGFKKLGSIIDPKGGPFGIKTDPGNKDLIMIESGTTAPIVGMDIVFPYYNMEGTVYKVESNGSNHYNVWMDGGLETKIKTKKGTNPICFYASRYGYVVENGNLNFYSSAPPPAGVTWPVTVARNIVNPTNRALAATPFSQTTTEYVTINLTTADNRFTNRNYKAVNTLLAGSVPIRAQLTITQ
jgi:hypothetical protein